MISVLESFEDFYYEILRQKEKALRITECDIKDEDAIAKNQNLIHEIQEKLLNFFDEQSEEFAKYVGSQVHKEAQYIMIVFADEVFLNLPWFGAKYWKKSMLEAKFYKTQTAGELFFKKLDALMKAPNRNNIELAHLYYFALTLGFKGRHRNSDDASIKENTNKIDWYIEQLFILIQKKKPELFLSYSARLIPKCYDYTVSEPPGVGLPDVRVWTICILGIIGLYVFITYIAWYNIASDMHEAINEVLTQNKVVF